MNADRRQLEERIQAYVDDRLTSEERRQLESRIAADPEARELLMSLSWLKRETREALGGVQPSAGLEQAIVAGLDDAAATDGPEPGRSSRATLRRFRSGPVAAAAVLVLMITVWALWPSGSVPRTPAVQAPSLVEAAAGDVARLISGDLPLPMITADVAEMEAWFDLQGIRFETRVFDLAMMDLTLVGGNDHELAGRRSAAFAYRRGDGSLVLCQMFEARADALPPGADEVEKDGIRFYSYRVGDVVLTFWKEGEVLCVLGATGDAEQVLQLAFGKAVKV